MGKRNTVSPGDRYGRLTIVREAAKSKSGHRRFVCLCDCGNSVTVLLNNLRTGNTRSCGCLRKEMAIRAGTRHGKRYTKEYDIWVHIIQRCENRNVSNYYNYGGRGVKVCKRWHKFENFYADMGPRPGPGYSIDRIDNNGDYTPENCRWATRLQQSNNSRNNHIITFAGETKTMAEWARCLGMKYGTLSARLNTYGWPAEMALTKKVGEAK